MRGFAWAAAAVLLLSFAPGAALAAKPDKPDKAKPEKPEKAGEAEDASAEGRGHGHAKGKQKEEKEKGRPPAGPAERANGVEPKEVAQGATASPIVVKALQKHAPARPEKESAGRGKVALCHATGSATNPFVLISVSVNATTANGHGRHAADVIPVGDGGCAKAQPDPVPEPEDPTVPPKDDPEPGPAEKGGDEPRQPVSQPEVLVAEKVSAVQGELPFTGLPLGLLALLGAAAAVAGGLLRRNERSPGTTTRPESK